MKMDVLKYWWCAWRKEKDKCEIGCDGLVGVGGFVWKKCTEKKQ